LILAKKSFLVCLSFAQEIIRIVLVPNLISNHLKIAFFAIQAILFVSTNTLIFVDAVGVCQFHPHWRSAYVLIFAKYSSTITLRGSIPAEYAKRYKRVCRNADQQNQLAQQCAN
jgi:hypothetical protein